MAIAATALEHVLPTKTMFLHLPRPFLPSERSSAALLDEACIELAISRISSSDRLIIWLDDTGQTFADRYDDLSDLYSTCWEVASGAGKPQLDVCVLLAEMCGGDFPQSLPSPSLALGCDEKSTAQLFASVDRIEFESLKTFVGRQIETLAASDICPVVFLDDPRSKLPALRRVAVGGTFDRLHSGHKKLLSVAAAISSESMLVGIAAGGLLAEKSGSSRIQSFEQRSAAVVDFIAAVKPNFRGLCA